MRATTGLSVCVSAALLACTSENGPTQPEAGGNPAAASSAAAASNTWTAKAPRPPMGPVFETFAGVAPNSAGQSIVYVFGGTDGEGTGLGTGAYNVATNSWTWRSSISIFAANGVGTIGNKLYFSGGYNEVETPSSFSNRLWAYNYAQDRFILKASLPIFGAEGVTGVIDDELYVLPGACSGDRYPDLPGYCAVEPTRRFYRYDPATNTWVTLRRAPHYHRQGAAAVIGGKFYVAGGFNDFQPVADLDVYDPATNTWRTLAPIPSAGRAIGTALKGKFHVLVGTNHYVYNPATNTWQTRAAAQWPHDAVVRVTLDGLPYLLAVGGTHGPSLDIPNDSELYTP